MDMIAIIIAFSVSLLWYFFDRRKHNNQYANQPSHHDRSVIGIDAAKREAAEKPSDEESRQKPLGRLYYSIPGKTYSNFIWKGRVLNFGKTWPYPPNNP